MKKNGKKRTTQDKKEERGRERKERMKEIKRYMYRQYKKDKARERNAKPRKNACQGEDQTNSTEMNRQRHATPNLCAVHDPPFCHILHRQCLNKVRSPVAPLGPRGEAYLNIARLRSARKLQNRVLRARAG